jgi:hypothetical protein
MVFLVRIGYSNKERFWNYFVDSPQTSLIKRYRMNHKPIMATAIAWINGMLRLFDQV